MKMAVNSLFGEASTPRREAKSKPTKNSLSGEFYGYKEDDSNPK